MQFFKELNTKILGKKIIKYEKIDSTQLEILRRIEKNKIENGTIIIADIQTHGVGTHGRKWHTSIKNNIAFSLFIDVKKINPKCSIINISNITTKIANIIVGIFKNLYEIKLEIKAPNDIMYKGKKIGGILTQTKLQGDFLKYIVIGIGINTNQEKFNDEIKDIATSIKNEFNIEINNKQVIENFCNIFENELFKKIIGGKT